MRRKKRALGLPALNYSMWGVFALKPNKRISIKESGMSYDWASVHAVTAKTKLDSCQHNREWSKQFSVIVDRISILAYKHYFFSSFYNIWSHNYWFRSIHRPGRPYLNAVHCQAATEQPHLRLRSTIHLIQPSNCQKISRLNSIKRRQDNTCNPINKTRPN